MRQNVIWMLSLSATDWETIRDLTMQVQSVSICTISNATTYRDCLLWLDHLSFATDKKEEEKGDAKIDFNIWKNLDL